jgi:hypothetical protein
MWRWFVRRTRRIVFSVLQAGFHFSQLARSAHQFASTAPMIVWFSVSMASS